MYTRRINLAFAILKLSYNRPGASTVTGGICGTGFFINSRTALTAQHVLNRNTFTPNIGFSRCQVWAISRNGLIAPLEERYVTEHPELDLSVIRFPETLRGATKYKLASCNPQPGDTIYTVGYIGAKMPGVNAKWYHNRLEILQCRLNSCLADYQGSIRRLFALNVNANDIHLRDVPGFEVSFGSRIGMSGGPVIDRSTDVVVGILSIGLPPDELVRTATFAISASAILSLI